MAIDVFHEKVISLKEAAKRLPKTARNKKIHISTLHRWIQRGLQNKHGLVVRLESIKIGGNICTSLEALQRFFEQISDAVDPVAAKPITSRERLRQIREAERILDEAGI